jgi:hypothetical protein
VGRYIVNFREGGGRLPDGSADKDGNPIPDGTLRIPAGGIDPDGTEWSSSMLIYPSSEHYAEFAEILADPNYAAFTRVYDEEK